MKVPGVIVMIGKAKIAAGVLAAVAVLAAGCGGSTTTTGQNTQQKPAPAQSTTRAPGTAYDTEVFLSLISTPEWAAFDHEKGSLNNALDAHDWAAAKREYQHLIPAADALLATVRATNPEPKYQGIKAHMIRAITEARDGARDGVYGMRNYRAGGIPASDRAKIDEANRHMDAASEEAQHVADEIESLIGP